MNFDSKILDIENLDNIIRADEADPETSRRRDAARDRREGLEAGP